MKIAGLIWLKEEDDVKVTIHNDNGSLVEYARIPRLSATLKQRALRQGKSLGDVVDIVNRQIEVAERRRRPQIRPWLEQLSVTWSIELDAAGRAWFSNTFGVQFDSSDRRADAVDGAAE